ncbi:MAG: PaaI family thioesterase [Clostridiales bacterium]|nr:PaaI family thioesterase [Clostridiales bacterium]
MDIELYKKLRQSGFIREVGFEAAEMENGYARCELVLQEKHFNPIGSVHGGVIFTMADTVGGAAAVSRGRAVTTVSGDIHFLRPAMNSKKLIGESQEVKTGKNMCVYNVMISDETGRQIAMATMTYYYIQEK